MHKAWDSAPMLRYYGQAFSHSDYSFACSCFLDDMFASLSLSRARQERGCNIHATVRPGATFQSFADRDDAEYWHALSLKASGERARSAFETGRVSAQKYC
jgi:hypothetical protein